jgi:hypothetical protein
MDVVYLVRPGQSNEELRYSLRSLKNIPHDNVWFVGNCPKWVQNVRHIPTAQEPGAKHQNSIRNQKAALANSAISDPYLLFNDDHFIMHKMSDMPILNWGTVENVLATEPRLGDSFARSMQGTLDLLRKEGYEQPLSYQLHTPLVVHKHEWLHVFRKFPNFQAPTIWLQYATIAGNIFHWGGETWEHDIKILEPNDRIDTWVHESPLLSSSDRAFRGNIGGFIKQHFPEPSNYEVRN